MPNPTIKFHQPTICDQIRREDNGKLFYIGVYGSSINVEKLPTDLQVFISIPVETKEKYPFYFELRIKYGKRTIAIGRADVEVEQTGDALVIVPEVLLKDLEHPDVLTFAVRLDKGRWKTIRSIPVYLLEG